jgi:hypothetical protein
VTEVEFFASPWFRPLAWSFHASSAVRFLMLVLDVKESMTKAPGTLGHAAAIGLNCKKTIGQLVRRVILSAAKNLRLIFGPDLSLCSG